MTAPAARVTAALREGHPPRTFEVRRSDLGGGRAGTSSGTPSRRGLTAVEGLLCLALGVLVMSMAWGLQRGFRKSVEQLDRASQRTAMVGLLREALAWDLLRSSAAPVVSEGGRRLEVLVGEESAGTACIKRMVYQFDPKRHGIVRDGQALEPAGLSEAIFVARAGSAVLEVMMSGEGLGGSRMVSLPLRGATVGWMVRREHRVVPQ